MDLSYFSTEQLEALSKMGTTFTVKIYKKNMHKIGSNFISGSLLSYIDSHHKLPDELCIAVEEEGCGKTITIPEYVISCLLQDIVELMSRGVKIKIDTFHNGVQAITPYWPRKD